MIRIIITVAFCCLECQTHQIAQIPTTLNDLSGHFIIINILNHNFS